MTITLTPQLTELSTVAGKTLPVRTCPVCLEREEKRASAEGREPDARRAEWVTGSGCPRCRARREVAR